MEMQWYHSASSSISSQPFTYNTQTHLICRYIFITVVVRLSNNLNILLFWNILENLFRHNKSKKKRTDLTSGPWKLLLYHPLFTWSESICGSELFSGRRPMKWNEEKGEEPPILSHPSGPSSLPPEPPTQHIRYQIEKVATRDSYLQREKLLGGFKIKLMQIFFWCCPLASGQGLDGDWSPFLDFIVAQEGVSPMPPLISGHFSALLQTCSSDMSFIFQNLSCGWHTHLFLTVTCTAP